MRLQRRLPPLRSLLQIGQTAAKLDKGNCVFTGNVKKRRFFLASKKRRRKVEMGRNRFVPFDSAPYLIGYDSRKSIVPCAQAGVVAVAPPSARIPFCRIPPARRLRNAGTPVSCSSIRGSSEIFKRLINLLVFGHSAQNSLEILQYSYGIFAQPDEKSDSAVEALRFSEVPLSKPILA